MGNRQGQRTDLDNTLPKSDKGKSADIAAEAVGMSGEQYLWDGVRGPANGSATD
jgi:hypothetical protein